MPKQTVSKPFKLFPRLPAQLWVRGHSISLVHLSASFPCSQLLAVKDQHVADLRRELRVVSLGGDQRSGEQRHLAALITCCFALWI